jgi:hypothetical protein
MKQYLVVAAGDHQGVIAVTYRVRSTNMHNNLVYDFYLVRGSRTLIPRSAPPIGARSVETC